MMKLSLISNRETKIVNYIQLTYESNQGSIVFISLGMLIILSIIGTTVLQIATLSAEITGGERDVLQSHYYAEAGLEHAVMLANHNWDDMKLNNDNFEKEISVFSKLEPELTYDLDVQNISKNMKQIRSVGKYGSGKVTITAVLQRQNIFGNQHDFLMDYFNYAIASNDLQINQENHYITGGIHSTENPPLVNMNDILIQFDSKNYQIYQGETVLTDINEKIDYLFVVEDGQESGDLTLKGDFQRDSDYIKPLVIIAQGCINVVGDQWNNSFYDPLILISLSEDVSAISLDVDNMLMHGALIAPWGGVKLKEKKQIELKNIQLSELESFHQIELIEIQTPKR